MVPKVFMFADHKDLILYTQACLAAVGNGCVIPLFAVIFGDLVNAMGADNIQKEVNRKVLQLVYLSIGALCLGCIEVSMSASSTKRQVNRGKSEIFSQILEKPMSWHQIRRSSGVIMTLMGKELPTIQLALGETVEGIRQAVTAVAGLIVAFSRGAKLTLFVLTILPVLFLINFMIKRLSKRLDVGLQAHRRESNFAVKETFSNIKTVASFNLETTFCDRYGYILSRLATFSLPDSFLSGLEVSIIAGIFSFAYALTIYNGAKYVAEGSYTGGQVIAVLFSAIMAGFSASQAIPCFNCTWNGHIAGQQISVALSPGSESKNLVSEPGKYIKDLNMDIEFIDVHFAYPTRPDRTILNSFNMILPSNTSTAIVGPSGSGKSTIINLLLKYYSPDAGGIFIDGVNLSEISAKEWRSNIAYIPQEVCIFSGSIVDNIRISKPSSAFNEVVSACKKARCHDFIQKLPNGYDTFLDSNNSLSGGQRQRIGIARAFLRDSRILLLDEATAALDNRSEQEINETMQQMFACEKTVVSIAHKLSTVMSMNSIAVAKDGRIVEQGSHSDLMATGKVYRSLVKTMTAADASFNEISPEEQNAPTKEKPVLRDSVLRKRSVRLSIIPEKIRKKLKIGQEEDGEEETKWTDIGALLRTAQGIDFSSLKSKILLALSLFSSCIMGLQYPAYSLALSGSVDAFLRPTPELIQDGGSKWALVYTGIGFGFVVFGALQAYSWTYVGEHLSSSIKQTIFQRAVSQPIDWHEKTDNDTSSMLTLLSNDSDNIKQALTTQVGALIQTFVTLTASLVIAFYSSATLTLVILSIFPLLLLAQLVQAWAKEGGYNQSGQDALNRFSFEATKNIRDIHTFSIEGILSNRFEYLIQRHNNQNIWIPGCAFGLSQFMLYNTISLAFWFGTRQVASFSISVEDLMRAFCSLFFATFSLAQTNSQFGVIGKAKESARKVQKVLQCAPGAVQGAKLPRYNGEISFDDVTFAYPCRPERLVFKHLNLHIKAHSSCALVGESGHGKSSCFGLLQSFYRPAEGVVRIDGIDINKLDTAWIRHITSFVTQDPVIFCGQSIRENIRYGDQNADEQRVIEAAKAAHCHQFIQTFPDGYDTLIGDSHVQLSGGQKQRIAIARAMLKNSGILLMDEPTAALDSISEKQILNSLKSFMQNKTCIVVAHRLGTIKDFDLIAAIYRGRVLEKGTHSELVQLGGYYNYLIQTQKQ